MDEIIFELGELMGYLGLSSLSDGPTYINAYINYTQLLDILEKDGVVEYDPSKFSSPKEFISTTFSTGNQHTDVFPTVEIKGKKRQLRIKVLANSKIGKIDTSKAYPFALDIDASKEKEKYFLYVPYVNATGLKGGHQYALIFAFDNFDDWYYTINYIHHLLDEEDYAFVIEAFKKAFIRAGNDIEQLDFLYEQAPLWVLANISNEIKFADLKRLLTGSVDEWGTNEELAVLNILKSFVTPPFNLLPNEKSERLEAFKTDVMPVNVNFLLKKCVTETVEGETVFHKLYDKLNDYGGENNFSRFINLFYLLWLESSYPLDDYKNNDAADVMVLDYQTSKILGFYTTSQDFEFYKERIIVTEQKITGEHYSVINKEMVKEISTVSVANVHIYQPIHVPQLKQAGDLQLPNNLVPAFFLKAIDDKNYWDNFEKAAWLAVDVISTVSGVGNLLKLRHLLNVAELGSIIRLGVAGIEVASDTLSIMLSLVDNCDGGGFCSKLQTFLIYLDFATLGVDTLSSKYLGRAAGEALEEMPDYLRKKHPDVRKKLEDIFSQDARRKILNNFELLSDKLLQKYLKDAVNKCKIKGITLEIEMIVEGHPAFNSVDLMGRFRITNDKKKVIMMLRPECPKITWFHESYHLEDFLEKGWKNYSDISRTAQWRHEESVWNKILKHRNKWSEYELMDSYLYYKSYLRSRGQNPKTVKDLEKLITKYMPK